MKELIFLLNTVNSVSGTSSNFVVVVPVRRGQLVTLPFLLENMRSLLCIEVN